MNARPIVQRHPALRWLVPVGIAGLAVFIGTGALGSSAPKNPALPPMTPTALMAAVQQPQAEGFSGTVVSQLSLGLPELPQVSPGDDSSFTSLLSGSHTLQVWYGGLDQQRIALLGSTEETDVFRDGREVWQWNSSDRQAEHVQLPERMSGPLRSPAAALLPATMAHDLLAALQPSTRVEVGSTSTVADRAAYDLVLTPRAADATKIGRVRISVDGRTKVPLGVQVYARGASAPSIEVAFTSIAFGRQDDRNFRFSPPSGAAVKQLRPSPGRAPAGKAETGQRLGRTTTTGHGWATVVATRPNPGLRSALRSLRQLSPVHGSWGSGSLLDTDLVSALLTDDGRLYVGAVPPQSLYAAAGSK